MALSLLRPTAVQGALLACILLQTALSSVQPASSRVFFGGSTLPPSPSPPPAKLVALNDPLDVWVIAGQSNAVGLNYADGQPMPRPCSDPAPGKLLMFPIATQTWTDAQASVSYISFGNPDMHAAIGPELRFGKALIEQNISSRVGIIPTAVSSTDLCNKWMPPRGEQWLGMIKSVQAGMAAAGPYAQLRGVMWVQGETDAFSLSCASSYQRNFRTFVNALRQATLKYHPQLPVIMAVMSTTNRTPRLTYIDMVRKAQLANDTLLPGIVKVDMEGLEFFNQYPDQPGTFWLHLTKSAQCTLGLNMARAWRQAGLQ